MCRLFAVLIKYESAEYLHYAITSGDTEDVITAIENQCHIKYPTLGIPILVAKELGGCVNESCKAMSIFNNTQIFTDSEITPDDLSNTKLLKSLIFSCGSAKVRIPLVIGVILSVVSLVVMSWITLYR